MNNCDTANKSLARRGYLLFKAPEKWTVTQKQRAQILYKTYPDIKKAHTLPHTLRKIFSKNTVKDAARLSLARWCNKVENTGFKSFNVIGNTIYENSEQILNFFINRATNAFAESFNAKIKAFRASLRGVIDVKFLQIGRASGRERWGD